MSTHAWRRVAKRAAERGILLAGALARAGIPLDDLPALLGCDPATAWHVAVCQPPELPAWPPERWAPLIAATFGLDEGRLLDLARRLVPEEEERP